MEIPKMLGKMCLEYRDLTLILAPWDKKVFKFEHDLDFTDHDTVYSFILVGDLFGDEITFFKKARARRGTFYEPIGTVLKSFWSNFGNTTTLISKDSYSLRSSYILKILLGDISGQLQPTQLNFQHDVGKRSK